MLATYGLSRGASGPQHTCSNPSDPGRQNPGRPHARGMLAQAAAQRGLQQRSEARGRSLCGNVPQEVGLGEQGKHPLLQLNWMVGLA